MEAAFGRLHKNEGENPIFMDSIMLDDVSVYVNVCVLMYFLCILVYAYVFVVFVYVFLCIFMYILCVVYLP